jgi:hypothetical protein
MNRDIPGHLAPFLVLTILVLSIGIATNLPYQFIPVSPSVHGNPLFGLPIVQTKPKVSMAGFPMTFSRTVWVGSAAANSIGSNSIGSNSIGSNSIASGDRQDTSPLLKGPGPISVDQWFSLWGVLINTLTWLTVAGLVVGLLRWRVRSTEDEAQLAKRRRSLEAFVAISILVLPCMFFGYHGLRLRKQNQLIQEITGFGACGTVTWLPRFIADQVPRALHPLLGQIHLVSVYEPSPELLQRLGGLPLLQALEIQGQTSLDPLAKANLATSIVQVSLIRMTLDESHNRFFKTHPQLQELLAYVVGGGPSEMAAVCELPNLRYLVFEDCELPLDFLSRAKSSDCVELLGVAIGIEADEELSIVGWPQLKEVILKQRGNRIKPWPTKIRFHDCAKLERVSLDGLRRYDAEFVGNPELSAVNPTFRNDSFSDVRVVTSFDQQYDRVILRDCPKLETLAFSLVGVRELDIANATGLKNISCTAYEPNRKGWFRLAKIDQPVVDQLLEQIGKISTLERLSFGGIPFDASNLAEISKLPALGELKFSYTAPDSSQIELLAPLQSLAQIDLPDCKLTDENLSFLLNRFPNLVGTTVDVSQVKDFQLKRTSNCRWITSTPFSSIESFHLSSPNFQSGFHLGPHLKNLIIEDSPKLNALVIDAPLPSNSRIKDLQNIQIFMVGGHQVNDTIFEAIENCVELDRLMLAYTSITKEKFQSIGNFALLRELAVPGNPIDDDMIRHWSDLNDLWSLDLSETQVDVAAIQWAVKNKSLRYLNLTGVQLSKKAREMLAELSQLAFLSVANTQLSPTELSKILRNPSLDYLDLSGIHLTPQHFDALAQSNPPDLIIAKDCGVSASQFKAYCDRQSSGCWDIGSGDSVATDLTGTGLANRLVIDGTIHSYHHSLSHRANFLSDPQAGSPSGSKVGPTGDSAENHPQRFAGLNLQAAGERATWNTSTYRAEKLALGFDLTGSEKSHTKAD